MTAILNVNDNNLLLQIGQNLSRTQGYAWLKNGGVHFDFSDADNAVAACRLEPQQINSRFWQQCEQTSLANNDSGMRHAADLIWRHLSELKQQHDLNELVLIVPSHYQAANLQLLLGIAKACGLKVQGLINKATLAAHQLPNRVGNLLHIDVQLHQTVCSELVVAGKEWRLTKTEVLHEVGLQAMQDALLKAAQERFIQSDRFDPLHYAETEQQLFDQLSRLAESVRENGKANINVMHGGKQYAASIDARQWATALEPFSSVLKAAKVALEPELRLYDFNGFEAIQFSAGDRSMARQGALDIPTVSQLVETDAEGKVIYQTALPVSANHDAKQPGAKVESSQKSAPTSLQKTAVNTDSKPTSSVTLAPNQATNQAPSPAPSSDAPTHLLFNGLAVPLAMAHIEVANNSMSIIRAETSNLATLLAAQQVFVLGDASRQELQVNDRLGSTLSDSVLTVIRVE